MTQELEVQAPTPTAMHFRDKIETIKQTVAKGATDAQLEMFLTLAERYQLDPFLKEIWFTPEIGIITGRDGYLKVAQRDTDFDGIVSAAVCEGDTFVLKPMIPDVQHEFGSKRGAVIGAYAVVFHKKRRPVVCYAPIAEYLKGSVVWQKYRSAMICKVAEVLALKRQFGISGLVTEEEVGTGSDAAPAAGGATPIVSQLAAEPEWVTKPHAKPASSPLQQSFAPDTPKELVRLYAKLQTPKKFEVFDELLLQITELCGEYDGNDAYREILLQHGAESSRDLKTLSKAKACVKALYEWIENAKAEKDKREEVTLEDVPA